MARLSLNLFVDSQTLVSKRVHTSLPLASAELMSLTQFIFIYLDPNYLLDCLACYNEDPVQRISDKMESFKGYYPRRPLRSEPGSVAVKNQYLHLLATELFPDCHVNLLRDCLLQQKHSHIEAVCEKILQEQQLPVRLQPGIIERHEYITSEQYRSQALNQLTHDYPNVRLVGHDIVVSL